MQSSHACFPCSATKAEDARRRLLGTEHSEQFSIDEAEQEDAHASLQLTRGDDPARAHVEGQRACQRASGFHQGVGAYGS
jgi:hypothetical protein